MPPALRSFLLFSILVFPLATLVVPNAESIICGLLMLYGLSVGWGSPAWRLLDRDEKRVWLAWLGMFGVAYLSFILGRDTSLGFRILGRDLRWAVFPPVYLAVRRLRPSARLVGWALLLGVAAAATVAIVAVAERGWGYRPRGVVGVPIVFGDLALFMGFMAVPLLLADGARPRPLRFLAAGAALAFGLTASILSESRGGWLAIPVFAMILAYAWLPSRSLRMALLVGLGLAAGFLLLVWVTPVGSRIRHAATDVMAIVQAQPDRSGALGCLDGHAYLSGLSKALLVLSDRQSLGIRVVSGRPALSASGWGSRCPGGETLAFDNRSHRETARVAFPQLQRPGQREWPVEFLVRGQGILSAGSGPRAGQAFRKQRSFAPVRVILDEPKRRPAIEIPPGGVLEAIPIQLYPGQYSDYPLETSLGLRLEMWRAAWRMFLEHPMLGVGTGAYRDTAAAWVRSGYLIKNATGYDHPHQDFLNTLASQGIVGLLFLLAVYYLPGRLFFRMSRAKGSSRSAFGLAGCLLTGGIVIGGLTETLFIHSAVITWYTVLVAVLSGQAS
jgi:hypothetical protein